ncbi:MAG: SDR family NAD(P)-dependent oxidoreductase [Acidobacteriota bacterium]
MSPAPASARCAVVTGGSAGIGAATVRLLAAGGWRVVTGARRSERLRALAEEASTAGASGAVHVETLDVTDAESVERFAARALEHLGGAVHLLVNNAGGALGAESIERAIERKWREMYELNVLSTLRMTRALLGALERSGDGHVINVGSIAGFETYPGGAGYTAAKHGLRALTRTLRLELLGRPVRVTEIAPGMVETEFSLVRFDGDRDRADGVYRGMQPLTGEDIAECIAWAASRPSHVNIDEILVRPRDQATATLVHRTAEGPDPKGG